MSYPPPNSYGTQQGVSQPVQGTVQGQAYVQPYVQPTQQTFGQTTQPNQFGQFVQPSPTQFGQTSPYTSQGNQFVSTSSPYVQQQGLKTTQFVQQPNQYGQTTQPYVQQPQYGQQPTSQFVQQPNQFGQPQQFPQSQMKQTQFVQQPQQGTQFPQQQFGQQTTQFVQQPQQGSQFPQQPQQGTQFPQQPQQTQQGTQFPQQPQQLQQPQQGTQFPQQPQQTQQGTQFLQQPQMGQAPNYQQQQLKPHQESSWGAQYYNSADQTLLNQLQQVFSQLDVNRSNTLTVNELANLNFAGKVIGLETAKKMVKVFDKDYSGSIEYFEFVAVYQFIVKMQTAFFNADADRSGFLESNEVYKALEGAGFNFSQATVQAICAKYNTPKGIDFDHFLQICGYLASLKSIFEWNDQQKSGKVNFSFDQLAHVCVHLLDPPNDILQIKYA